jgi:hypothetical protein
MDVTPYIRKSKPVSDLAAGTTPGETYSAGGFDDDISDEDLDIDVAADDDDDIDVAADDDDDIEDADDGDDNGETPETAAATTKTEE